MNRGSGGDSLKQEVGCVGSGLVGLCLKIMLTGESFPVFRNWLVLAEAVLPEPARRQMSAHQNTGLGTWLIGLLGFSATFDPPS